LTEEFYRSKDFIKNMELPKFLITSYDNKKYSIKDFNGKIIYIDIWATWCTPCINQIPNLILFQSKLESRNIIFLTISIDDDIAAWRDFIKKNPQYKGNHFIYINDRFNNFLSLNSLLNITSIPRYIIIDTNGRIHSINAESPESQNLFKELLELTE
jgi:thiol-disulfide isomerase/thioredoxin